MNLRTHDHAPAHLARARGWRREWRALPEGDHAFLTAVPDAGAEIEGVIAPVPGGDWRALDLREAFYDRLDATEVVHHDGPAAAIAIYAVPETRAPRAPGRRTAPILLSYLDVVLQGYLDMFGEAGAARFFDTTEGWETPVLDDRAAPLYPRAQVLPASLRGWIDKALAARGIAPFAA
ncbi:gamma-glutamylcyclotransferase family protein [Roseivivax isoporae]|uniref:gamma-glutamylcyclotransferase family protein n=1 Tax=Roseivivax isoporae TaxID=591206 RepID=UPI003138192E